MNISRTTLNFAVSRNLDVTEEINADTSTDQVWIWEADNDMEPLVIYSVNKDGSFTFHSNICIDMSIKEELPAHIRNEKHLREVINFIGMELKV